MPLAYVDKQSAQFAKNLDLVLADLNKRIINILAGASHQGEVGAGALLDSKAAILQALEDAGFYDLAAQHAAGYEGMVESVTKYMTGRGVPAPKFRTIDKTTFQQLAGVDIEGIEAIGKVAVEKLHLSLYKNALSGTPFADLVAEVAGAIGGPLKNHAYTYANTANLNFSGEILRVAGEGLGADRWEVVGPLDESTRDVCVDALSDPVRTKEEWQAAGYFGGTPGGWSCRHQLFPVFDGLEDD